MLYRVEIRGSADANLDGDHEVIAVDERDAVAAVLGASGESAARLVNRIVMLDATQMPAIKPPLQEAIESPEPSAPPLPEQGEPEPAAPAEQEVPHA